MEIFNFKVQSQALIIGFLSLFSFSCSAHTIPFYNSSYPNQSTAISALINHDYNEINHLKIFWSQIFLVESSNYYVYLYSLSCSHCAELKNPIIGYALSGVTTIYFVQESSSVVIDEKKAMSINVTNIEDLGIRGFPTLLLIENKTLINQYAGVTSIRNALHI